MSNPVRFAFGESGAKGVASEIDQLKDKFAKLQQQGAKGFAIGAGAAITAKGLSLVGDAAEGAVGFLLDSAKAYQQQEVATNRLTTSLRDNAVGWDGNMAAVEAANKAGMALGFTDTDTANAIALLVAATHSQAEALKVLAVAQDLARFKGVSLADAAQALTSIEAGRARGLAQLGINVKDFATTEERLAAVEKVAGGQAAQYADSDLGKLDIATAKVDQAQEKFGKGLSHLEAIVLPAAADALEVVASALDDVTTSVSTADEKYNAWLKTWGHFRASVPGGTAVVEKFDASVGNTASAVDNWAAELDAANAAQKALNGTLATGAKRLNSSAADAMRYYEWLRKIAGLGSLGPDASRASGSTIGGTSHQNYASGGVIRSGMSGLVGEDGPERYDAMGGVVKITPLGKGASGTASNSAFGLSQGDVHVHVHLPNAYGMTPGQGEALARAIEPHITRAQQRRGHLAPARAF